MPQTRVSFQPKLAGETTTLTFDFAARLGVSETISTQVTTCAVYSGTDANPSAVISGAASASGTVVSQNVTGGVVGVMYQLVCTITTSLGQTLQMSGFFTVVPDVI